MWTTGTKWVELMMATGEVVQSRSQTIAAACRDPAGADHRELARMVPEKVQAFSQAHAALARDAGAIQSEWLKLASMSMSGALLSPAGALDWWQRSARLVDTMAGTAGKAMTPVHRAATGNAKRLRKARRKSGQNR